MDQGRRLVVGFTDDEETKFQGPLPVIVFGDHTREVKFIDFDFAVGADGTVLLRPDSRIEPRFFYYWLQNVTLHQLGYSRHSKLLAEKTIRFPVSLDEQRLLVTEIEALNSRAQELRDLTVSLAEDTGRAVAAEYARITRDAPIRRFGEVARLARRQVTISSDKSYLELGIRSFGKGTFHKPALTGRQLGGKRIFKIKSRDLVFMNVFAWEGAIAVAKPEDEGRVGSHRFMAHEVDTTQATPEYLCHYFLSEYGLEKIRAASPGSAGRNRTLGIKKLLAIPVPAPPVEAQICFSELCALQEGLCLLQTAVETDLTAFTPALIARIFNRNL